MLGVQTLNNRRRLLPPVLRQNLEQLSTAGGDYYLLFIRQNLEQLYKRLCWQLKTTLPFLKQTVRKTVSATQNHASFFEADRAHNRILRQDMSDHLSLLEQPPPLLPTLPLLFVPAQVRGQEYAVG